jgi:hypothetical protein
MTITRNATGTISSCEMLRVVRKREMTITRNGDNVRLASFAVNATSVARLPPHTP